MKKLRSSSGEVTCQTCAKIVHFEEEIGRTWLNIAKKNNKLQAVDLKGPLQHFPHAHGELPQAGTTNLKALELAKRGDLDPFGAFKACVSFETLSNYRPGTRREVLNPSN